MQHAEDTVRQPYRTGSLAEFTTSVDSAATMPILTSAFADPNFFEHNPAEGDNDGFFQAG
jgi:hypothetical protein